MSVQPIAVINMSTKVTDAQVALMVQALNTQLPAFCTSWSLRSSICQAYTKTQKPTAIYKIYIYDSPDQAGALGYHTEDTNGIYGKVFVNPVLQARGGGVLKGTVSNAPTVSSVLSHEALEMLKDPNVNTWWVGADGSSFYAAEVCDPVQGNVVKVTISGQEIWLSDYILPVWSDGQQKKGPFNYLNTLKRPLSVDKGGYIVQIQAGVPSYIFGSSLSEYTKMDAISDSERASLNTRIAAAKQLGISVPSS